MALTYTPEAKLGSACPDFTEKTVFGETKSLDSYTQEALVFMFICNHCPYVKAIENRLVSLSNKLQESHSVKFIAVCSNDATDYPEDSAESLKATAEKLNFKFDYLVDTSQKMAKDFTAVCTPDFFVYNKNRKLTYRGRLDDSWKNEATVTEQELENAILSTLNAEPIQTQKPSMGCSIKWKEPSDHG